MNKPNREQIARIIDPEAWNALRGPWNADSRWLSEDHRACCLAERQLYAKTKADEILASPAVQAAEARLALAREALITARTELFALCEATMDECHDLAQRDTEGKQGAFARGRKHEAKGISRAMGEVFHALSLPLTEGEDKDMVSPGTDAQHQERLAGTHIPLTPDLSVAQEGALFTDFYEPLRSDLTYLQAALSFYWGGPASDDVRGAWDRTLAALRNLSEVCTDALNGEGL